MEQEEMEGEGQPGRGGKHKPSSTNIIDVPIKPIFCKSDGNCFASAPHQLNQTPSSSGDLHSSRRTSDNRHSLAIIFCDSCARCSLAIASISIFTSHCFVCSFSWS